MHIAAGEKSRKVILKKEASRAFVCCLGKKIREYDIFTGII